MSDEKIPNPILAYATPRARDENRHFDAMRRWRSISGIIALLTIVSLCGTWPIMPLLGVCVLLGSIGATLTFMFRAALEEVGFWYALRHLVLAILLTPFLGLGVFLVTRVIESNIIYWRATRERALDTASLHQGDTLERDG